MSYDKSAISSTPPWLQQPARDDTGNDDSADRAAGRHTENEPNDDADAAGAVGRGSGHRPPPPSWLAASPERESTADARPDGDVADATRWVTAPTPEPRVTEPSVPERSVPENAASEPSRPAAQDRGPTETSAPPQQEPGVAPGQGFGPPAGAPNPTPPSTPPPWAAPDADRGPAQAPAAPWGQPPAPQQFGGPPPQFQGAPQFQGPPQQFDEPPQFDRPQQFDGPPQFQGAPPQFGGPPQFDPAASDNSQTANGAQPGNGGQPFNGAPRFDAPPQFPAAPHQHEPPQQFEPPRQYDAPQQYEAPQQFEPPQQFEAPQQFGQPQGFAAPRQFENPRQGQAGPPTGYEQRPAPEQPANSWPAPPVTPAGPPPISPASDPFVAQGGFAPAGPPPGYAPAGYAPNGYGAPAPSGHPQPGFTHTTPGGGDGPYPPTNGTASLDQVALLRKARRAPNSGWRRAVHRMSAGAINPGDSPDDLIHNQLIERVNRPVRGDYRIAVLSLKGGVGKTTTTVGLGSVFASLRGDRVIAVDANPDLGTLAQRIPQQTRSTVRDLLADNSIYRYSDVRAHTSQAPSRLEVLASERDPAVAEAFSEDDYRGVMKVLQRFYNIIITDCGTGLSHSAMNGVLDLANALILVSSPAIDGARSAGATLDWLQAHGYGHLVSRAVVVLSSSRSGASTIDTNQLSQHFLTRCRAVQSIPFDDHLAEGAEVDLDLLGKGAHRAFVELAATVADDFSATNLRRAEPYLQ
ncbi:AAA family ATPase [Williamsia sp. M5A3_1d]